MVLAIFLKFFIILYFNFTVVAIRRRRYFFIYLGLVGRIALNRILQHGTIGDVLHREIGAEGLAKLDKMLVLIVR